jgi:hypothetical protein
VGGRTFLLAGKFSCSHAAFAPRELRPGPFGEFPEVASRSEVRFAKALPGPSSPRSDVPPSTTATVSTLVGR